MPGGETWIAVVGPGDAAEEELVLAEQVGAAVAEAGAVLVCGGRGGVMAAACEGASAHDGLTVGLLPGNDRDEANPWVRVAIPTGLGEVRNALVVRAAHAVVAVGAGFGTLSEIGLALRDGRPVVGLATWELRHRGDRVPGVVEAADAGGAVREALRLAGHASKPST